MTKLHLQDIPQLSFRTSNIVSTEEVMNIADSTYDKYDFDVFMPTFNRNLQRDYVWPQNLASSLITSILLGRPIPPVCLNINHDKRHVEVIDGKQRILSAIKFYQNELYLKLPGNPRVYYFDDLDKALQLKFKSFTFDAFVHFEHAHDKSSILTDAQKVEWFLHINNSNVPQEVHICEMEQLLNK